MLRNKDVYFLVFDGNSIDGTQHFLAEAHGLIDDWVSETDFGIYDAMNRAVDRLPPEDGHVIFLGAGDQLIGLPDNNCIQADAILFGNVQVGAQLFVSSISWKLMFGNTLHHQGLFYPRNVFSSLRFDVRYKVYGDFDLNLRLYRARFSFIALNKSIAFAEPGGVSWSASYSEIVTIARRNGGFFYGMVAWIWARYRAMRLAFFGTRW